VSQPLSEPGAEPRIVVLLATHNGVRWLDEQVTSILNQAGVSVRIVALDDGSTDGTIEWLADFAAREPRLTVLPDDGTAGSAAANFYRLIAAAPQREGELVAFSDQDDIWRPGKLARHAVLLAAGVDGVSSSVMSFDSRGRTALVRKDYPQRRFDFVLESPGPGCSFLITGRLAALAAEVLANDENARAVQFHDSLVYAIARGHGWSWNIDGEPSVDYRQHDANVMGSNVGVRQGFERLRLIREHWLRNHSVLLTSVAIGVAPEADRAELERIRALMTGRGIRNRFALAGLARQLRRRPRDRGIIGLLIALGVW
jgi:rhamnosyltransferase